MAQKSVAERSVCSASGTGGQREFGRDRHPAAPSAAGPAWPSLLPRGLLSFHYFSVAPGLGEQAHTGLGGDTAAPNCGLNLKAQPCNSGNSFSPVSRGRVIFLKITLLYRFNSIDGMSHTSVSAVV